MVRPRKWLSDSTNQSTIQLVWASILRPVSAYYWHYWLIAWPTSSKHTPPRILIPVFPISVTAFELCRAISDTRWYIRLSIVSILKSAMKPEYPHECKRITWSFAEKWYNQHRIWCRNINNPLVRHKRMPSSSQTGANPTWQNYWWQWFTPEGTSSTRKSTKSLGFPDIYRLWLDGDVSASKVTAYKYRPPFWL